MVRHGPASPHGGGVPPVDDVTLTDLRRAEATLREGGFICIYDGDDREGEADLFLPAAVATPPDVTTLRVDGGGLIFVAVDPAVAKAMGLPFLHDVFSDASEQHPLLRGLVPDRLPYDARSSFSIPVNHRETYTGVTDADRALTIRELGLLAAQVPELTPTEAQAAFAASFRAPGHVHLCVAAEGLLDERQGHTELAVVLARMAGITPLLVGCEMMAPGVARTRDEARRWAEDHGTVLLDGSTIREAWRNLNAPAPDTVLRA